MALSVIMVCFSKGVETFVEGLKKLLGVSMNGTAPLVESYSLDFLSEDSD